MRRTKKFFEEITITGKTDEVTKIFTKYSDKGYSMRSMGPIQIDMVTADFSRRKLIIRKEIPRSRIVKEINPNNYQLEEDGEGYAFCPTEKALKKFAKDGGWDTIEDLEEETSLAREELIGKWFLIIGSLEGSRVFIK
jgi:hypothetical protein